MPRPKGSKNKTTLARETVEEPREFDYERDDVMFDNSYRETGNQPKATVAMSPKEAFVASAQIQEFPKDEPMMLSTSANLYLVEGEVQMSPREQGRGSIVAKQFRLVSATNEEEAVAKYSNYFRSLTDASAVYSVLRAAAMETIR